MELVLPEPQLLALKGTLGFSESREILGPPTPGFGGSMSLPGKLSDKWSFYRVAHRDRQRLRPHFRGQGASLTYGERK